MTQSEKSSHNHGSFSSIVASKKVPELFQNHESDNVDSEDNLEIDENLNRTESLKSKTTDPGTTTKTYKWQIVWRNVFAMSALHLLAVLASITIPYIQPATLYFAIFLLLLSALGVQAGAHRLWAHRTYKAAFGLRLFLSLCFAMALQNDIYEWSRDHRGHHKFSETDADPHNSKRGFFFSHVGWLLVKKHPDVIRRGGTIDMSDLERDPIVMFQRRFYIPLVLIFWAALPTFVPVYFWGENVWYALMVCVFFRYVYSLNITWFVNSWSHLYGGRPYDHGIAPVEATIRHMLMGEGFHNYHHAFPWDYSASELGAWDVFNPCTAAIDFFHWMGWAWDLKKVNKDLVERTKDAKGNRAEKFYYKRNTSLYEWVVGIACVGSPLLLFRYILKLWF